jgi:cytochrome c biogenesis protein CcmG/thiol:disulfide interchange protein DsbE
MTLAIVLLAAVAACSGERQASSPRPKAKPSVKVAAAPAQPASEVGDVMPPYSAKLLDGKSFDVAAQKGSVVLLNVWATWCGPCRFEVPELQKLHEKYGQRGLKVVGVSVDEGEPVEVKKFVAENKITYPIALDAEGHVANVLRTVVLPTSVIIGRDGRIVWRRIGPVMPNETAALDEVVQRALAKKS